MNKVTKRYNSEIKSLGLQLKRLRNARNLTQLDIEVASGIDRTEISRIESGTKNIEFLTLVKLAIALDVSLFQLFPNE